LPKLPSSPAALSQAR